MNFGLSEEQEMIVNTVRSFVEKEIYPHEDLVEQSAEVPREIAQDIKQKTIDIGFYACNFPESVGAAVCPMLILPWSSASWAEARWR